LPSLAPFRKDQLSPVMRHNLRNSAVGFGMDWYGLVGVIAGKTAHFSCPMARPNGIKTGCLGD
jgi:hypothetical protein